MAEFCLKCFNEMFSDVTGKEYKENEVWLEEDLCEGCAEIKPCVMATHPKPLFWKIVDKLRRDT